MHFILCLEMPEDHQDLLPYPFQRDSTSLTIPQDKGCASAGLADDASSLGLGVWW